VITSAPGTVYEDVADFAVHARRGKARGKTFELQQYVSGAWTDLTSAAAPKRQKPVTLYAVPAAGCHGSYGLGQTGEPAYRSGAWYRVALGGKASVARFVSFRPWNRYLKIALSGLPASATLYGQTTLTVHFTRDGKAYSPKKYDLQLHDSGQAWRSDPYLGPLPAAGPSGAVSFAYNMGQTIDDSDTTSDESVRIGVNGCGRSGGNAYSNVQTVHLTPGDTNQ
jgi:hypothetical protein